MHNNFTLDKAPKPPKAFYTAVEAAILWARSERAKSASDPRIAYYSRLIEQALKAGDLRASLESPHASPSSAAIASRDLKDWACKHFQDSRFALVLSKK